MDNNNNNNYYDDDDDDDDYTTATYYYYNYCVYCYNVYYSLFHLTSYSFLKQYRLITGLKLEKLV